MIDFTEIMEEPRFTRRRHGEPPWEQAQVQLFQDWINGIFQP
jgi:hypothetical protein